MGFLDEQHQSKRGRNRFAGSDPSMKSIINELWHGNIIPQEDSRMNSKEMKELLGYMSRHHKDLEKTFTDEQKEIFEKFYVAKSETIEYRFGRVKPPGATIRQS